MAYSDTVQKQQQKQAMERQRFGATREEILDKLGRKCSYPLKGNDFHEGDLVIDHIMGGGRHDTERGMFVEGKTDNIKNMRVLCRKHAGMIDRLNFVRGIGRNTEGNPNNPSQ